jgi:uncharacterized protein (DUF433 family)
MACISVCVRWTKAMSIQIENEIIPLGRDADDILRVSHTRVTLDSLVAAFQDGATAEEIVQQYPSLPLADVYAVIGYYLKHRTSVDEYLERRNTDRTKVQEENEAMCDPHGLRERLLARRNQPPDKP